MLNIADFLKSPNGNKTVKAYLCNKSNHFKNEL